MSATANSCASSQLPVELLHQIFDDAPADINDLVHASSVCRGWRAAVFAYPKYYKHVSLSSSSVDDMTNGRIALASARLQSGPPSQKVSVDIIATGYSCSLAGSKEVSSFCFKTLREQLPRLQSLEVCYSDIVLHAAVKLLGARPSALRHLSLSPGFVHIGQYHIPKRINGRILPVALPGGSVNIETRLPQPRVDRFLGRPPFITDKRVPTHIFLASSPTADMTLHEGMIRRWCNERTVTLPRSLHSLAPNLRSLKLHLMELPESAGIIFPTVEALWVENCTGLPLNRIAGLFPNLQDLGLAENIPNSADQDLIPEIEAFVQKLQWFHSTDISLFATIACSPTPGPHHLTLLDCPRIRVAMEDFPAKFFTLVHRWFATLRDDTQTFHLEPFKAGVDPDGLAMQIRFRNPASQTSCGTRVLIWDHYLKTWYSRQMFYLTNADRVPPLAPALVSLSAPSTHLCFLLSAVGRMPRLRTVNIFLHAQTKGQEPLLLSWLSTSLPELRTVRLRREKSSPHAVIRIRRSQLLALFQTAFTLNVGPQVTFLLDTDIELEGEPSVRSILFEQMVAARGL